MSQHARMRILFVTLGLFLFACEREDPTGPVASDPGLAQPRLDLIGSVPHVCGQASTDLVAGRALPVGTVTVANDDDMLYVSFEASAGWSMARTHVAVASSPEGLPSQNGQLIPGRFPSKAVHDPYATTVHHAVPLSAPEGSTHVVVAAHADVVSGDLEEGAWADGSEAGDVGGWQTYVMYEIASCAITAVVDSDGGVIEGDGVRLTISPGALTSSQEISVASIPIEELTTPALPEGVRLLPGTAFELTPDGLEFAESALLEISYDDTELTPNREGALAIFTLRSDGTWEERPGRSDPERNVVEALLEHFSVYVIVDTGIQFELRQGPSTYEGTQLGNLVLFRNLRTTPLSTVGLAVTLNVDGPVSSLSNPTSTPSCSRTEPTGTSIEYTCTLTGAEIAAGSARGWLITHLFDPGSAGTTVTVTGGYTYGSVDGVTAPLVTTVERERFADVSVRLEGPGFGPAVGEPFGLDLTLQNDGPSVASPVVYELELTGPVRVVSVPPGCFEPLDLGASLLVECGDAYSPLPSMAVSEEQTLPFTLVRDASEPVVARATIQVVDAIDTNPGNDESTWSCAVEPECTGEEPPPPPEPTEADLWVAVTSPASVTLGSPLVVDRTVGNLGPSDAPEGAVLLFTEVTAAGALEDFVFDDTACDGFRVSSLKVRVSCVMPAIAVGTEVSPPAFSVRPTLAGSVVSIQSDVRTIDSSVLVDPDPSNNATMLDVLITP